MMKRDRNKFHSHNKNPMYGCFYLLKYTFTQYDQYRINWIEKQII